MGVFAGEVTPAGLLVTIRTCAVVNMMECGLGGGPRHVHTYICNFFQQYAGLFTEAAVIVIERQPPQSAGVAVEVMFRERFGAKCVYIHPATIHARFGMAGYTYDGRKARSVATASQFLEDMAAATPGAAAALAALGSMERQHDCADACLMFIMHCEAAVPARRPVPPSRASAATPFAAFLEAYRYVGPRPP